MEDFALIPLQIKPCRYLHPYILPTGLRSTGFKPIKKTISQMPDSLKTLNLYTIKHIMN